MPDPFQPNKISLAVITGDHAFDVPNFHALFRTMPEVDFYVQTLFDFITDWGHVREKYDAVLFYNMHTATPTPDEMYWGQNVSEAFTRLGETGQGIVVLHHALAAFPHWPIWAEIIGVPDRAIEVFPNQAVLSQVTSPDHPIVRGLNSWEIVDETYTLASEPDASNEILLTYDSPLSMKAIAWTRTYKKSRVFCYQAGHDNSSWANPNFQEVLQRAISWTVGRL